MLARARAGLGLGGHQRLGREVPLIRAPRERAALVGDVRAARAGTGEGSGGFAPRGGRARAGETIHPARGLVDTPGSREPPSWRAREGSRKIRDPCVRVAAFATRRAVFWSATTRASRPR